MVISNKGEDIQLARFIAETQGYAFHKMKSLLEIQKSLATIPDWFILYDGEDQALTRSLVEMLPKYIRASKIIAVTNDGLEKNKHLLKYPFYGHHFLRNFSLPAPDALLPASV